MSNGHDPKLQPKPLPKGFSEQMMVYDKFADLYGWSPRVVDDLTLDEMFWLPIIKEAKAEAAAQLAALDQAKTKD